MSGDFCGKRVTVMGLGLYKEGSGMEAVKFFLRQGAKVTVTDLRSAKELEPSVRELVRYYSRLPRVIARSETTKQSRRLPRALRALAMTKKKEAVKRLTFFLGKHREEDFKNANVVFQNPSVPADSPYLRIAAKRKIPIVNDWSLFLSRHTPKVFVGVTGTRGKSTTTALIYEMLKRANVAQAFRPDVKAKALSYTTTKKIYLAGNLGTSPLAFIDTYRGEPIVAELSSWLLHHFADVKKSPNVAVVTNIMNDHMDKYRSQREYIEDKENIFRFQTKNDVLVLNRDNSYTRAMARHARGRVIWFSSKIHDSRFMIHNSRLMGEHNVANVNAAVVVAKVLGIGQQHIEHVLKTFHGLPGRLELVRTVNGVHYYNDTTATTPEAAIVGLKTLGIRNYESGIRNIVLIAGGADKQLEYREMAKYVKKYCKAVVLLPGMATKKVKDVLRSTSYVLPTNDVKSMREAVKKAHSLAQDGDIVLLSPAAASFGLFKNEFDRGRQFVALVRKLKAALK